MRNVKYLIEDIREASENLDVSDFIGIKDKEILRYINDAQERLQAQIVKKSQKVFVADYYIDCDGSESYELPKDIFLGNKITDVKYKPSTALDYHWERLEPDYVVNRDLNERGYPSVYIRQRGRIFLKPQPTSGQIRMTYVYNVPALDLKRASVLSATIDDTLKRITSLTLDISKEIEKEVLLKRSHLTIVDSHGIIIVDGIKFDDINLTTGEVALSGGFHQLPTGRNDINLTAIGTGSTVVSGKRATTHSYLDETVERYLIGYAVLKLLQRDGSQEVLNQAQLVTEMEAEIIESYALMSDDVIMIPDINKNWDVF